MSYWAVRRLVYKMPDITEHLIGPFSTRDEAKKWVKEFQLTMAEKGFMSTHTFFNYQELSDPKEE
jgi:hypothetical protein